MKKSLLILGMLCAAVTTVVLPTQAAEPALKFPDKPIKLIVPFVPGGFTDSMARLTAEQMSSVLGQSVIVENKPGANGIIAAEYVSRAPADGYTLMVASAETLAINPNVYKDLRYKADKDFVPVGSIVSVPLFVTVNSQTGDPSLADFVARAKKNPKQLSYASWGTGSTGHFAVELFNSKAGTEMTHIPYKGTGPGLVDVMGGRVDMILTTLMTSEQFARDGKVRLLAITSPQRSRKMPEIPTASELGIENYDVALWYGIVAPAGTPEPVIARLNAALREATSNPKFKASMDASDAVILVRSPAEFGSFLDAERSKWGTVAKSSNIVLQQ
jgi:tripartite-type tricarboxylate transporter receptor subunit TctC